MNRGDLRILAAAIVLESWPYVLLALGMTLALISVPVAFTVWLTIWIMG